jgi:hypothetical protein
MTDIVPVSNSIRNRHKKALARRAAWRKSYTELQEAIRIGKKALFDQSNPVLLCSPTIDGTNLIIEIRLSDLRGKATEMMQTRQRITSELRATAYPWV